MKIYLQTSVTALEKMHSSTSHREMHNLIVSYLQHRRSSGFSESTILNDVKGLIALSKSIKDIKVAELTPDDMYHFFDDVAEHRSSAALYRSKVAIFLRFAGREELAELCGMRTPRNTKKLPEDMLTQSEVEELISATGNARDAAFIALLYESGARRGEVMELQLKHITFDENGAVILLPKGKTGPRRIRVVFAASYLHLWMDHHPAKGNKSAWLWPSFRNSGVMVEYTTLRDMLQRAAKKAGITKRVNMHSFRHARATHLAKNLTEQQLKIYLGWTAGSSMAATYVHLSGKDVDDAILRAAGVEIPEERKRPELATVRCVRCKELQSAKNAFCFKCGLPMSETAYVQEKQAEADILKVLEENGLLAALTSVLQSKLKNNVG